MIESCRDESSDQQEQSITPDAKHGADSDVDTSVRLKLTCKLYVGDKDIIARFVPVNTSAYNK